MFNRKKIRELKREIFLLKNKPKYKKGDLVDFLLFNQLTTKPPKIIKCVVDDCFFVDGKNAYPTDSIEFNHEYILESLGCGISYSTYYDGVGKILCLSKYSCIK